MLLIDPVYGVEPQAVDAQVDPFVGRGREVFECGRFGSLVERAVVQIRHGLVEAGEVIAAVGQLVPRAHPGVRGSAEIVHLAVPHIAVRVVGEDIIVAVRAIWFGAGLPEPGILVAGMVQHVVHVDVDAPGLRLVDQVLEIGFRAEFGINHAIVRDIIAVVGTRSLDR